MRTRPKLQIEVQASAGVHTEFPTQNSEISKSLFPPLKKRYKGLNVWFVDPYIHCVDTAPLEQAFAFLLPLTPPTRVSVPHSGITRISPYGLSRFGVDY